VTWANESEWHRQSRGSWYRRPLGVAVVDVAAAWDRRDAKVVDRVDYYPHRVNVVVADREEERAVHRASAAAVHHHDGDDDGSDSPQAVVDTASCPIAMVEAVPAVPRNVLPCHRIVEACREGDTGDGVLPRNPCLVP